jgi:acetolactate synthase-1/2/3 large subunit
LLEQADLVLVVGSRIDIVSDATAGARFPQRIVQIDIDPLIVGQRRPVEVGIVGDAALVLGALIEALGKDEASASWFDIDGFREKKRAKLVEHAVPVLPLIESLRVAVPLPRTLIHPGTYGTLGYSLPAAIGAKLACPGQTVVSISGDGGFMFTAQELATARALNLDLIALVFNDNAFGAIRKYQDRMFGSRHIGSELANPDFVKFGEAFGVSSVRAEATQVGDAVKRAHQTGGTWLIEVPFAPGGAAEMVPWMP